MGGALTTLAAWLIEFAPGNLGASRLEMVHPWWALTWWGGGEVLIHLLRWLEHNERPRTIRDGMTLGGSIAAAATGPIVAISTDSSEHVAADPMATRLTNLADGTVAENFGAWISQPDSTPKIVATLLPLLLIAVAGGLLWRGARSSRDHGPLWLALGPVVLAVSMGFSELRWWSSAGAALLVVAALTMAILTVSGPKWRGWALVSLWAMLLLPGFRLLSPGSGQEENAFTLQEVAGLIERNVAHWLAERVAPDAVVLAPPALATSLGYYGGLKTLGTFAPENKEGMAAAGRIAAAISPDEARNLMNSRGVTHIVVPTWDPFLDEFARLGSNQPQNAFISALHQWSQPLWLRPVPYQLPTITGFEGQSVAIFEMVPEQTEALALSRQAEYFLEMGRPDLAVRVASALERFPADLGALVARARVAKAVNRNRELDTVLTTLQPLASYGLDRDLPWDRRISLVVVLAQNEKTQDARQQLQACLEQTTVKQLEFISTASLYHLHVLRTAFNLKFPNEELATRATELLPVALRERI